MGKIKYSLFSITTYYLLVAFHCLNAESGLTAAEFLRRDLSAKSAALGGAITALPSELDSLGSNPAGLATLEENSLLTSYANGFSGTDNFGFIAWAWPKLAPVKAALGLSYFDAGSISLNLSNGTRENRKAEQDWAILAGMAAKPLPRLGVGATIKLFQLALAEEFKANSTAFDLGAIFETGLPLAWGKILLGASLTNLGNSVTFLRDSDPMPTKQSLGLAWQKEFSSSENFAGQNNSYQLSFLADYSQTKKENPMPSFGLELHKSSLTGENDWGAIRVGYQSQGVSSKPSFGFGWGWGGAGLDYAALMLPQGVGFNHILSLRFVF